MSSRTTCTHGPAIRVVLLIAALLLGSGCGRERANGDEAADANGGSSTAAPAEGADAHGGEDADAAKQTGEAGHAEDQEALRISSDVQARFGISSAPAGPAEVDVTIDLPGEIESDPDRLEHVKPRFAGTIQRVFQHAGSRVERGDPLAVIESAQALAEYTVKAGITGTITEEHVPIGESVDVTHELFTIADTRVVWVQLQVFPGELDRVRAGNAVEILLPSATSGLRGEISFVTPVLDHATRTATARVVLENPGSYLPGLFVTGRVVVDRIEAPVVTATSALVRKGRDWVVFVREGPERFERRPVSVGSRGLERSAITAGLEAGEEVVVDGAFLVKSARARNEMGGGHGH